jgi:hypothetical protein
MKMAETPKAPRQPLIDVLLEANKRAHTNLVAMRDLTGKLFGPRPEETTAAMPEMSVAGLAGRLVQMAAEMEEDLSRLHTAVGDINVAQGQQGRAVSY